ncbi:MAG: ComF family protein [Candidatus Bipolaricaulota bacterium]|nr:ComF family protein [Candidatus Bipolaricaulota bacterium]
MLSLLFPPSCLLCGGPTRGLDILCEDCRSGLPGLSGPRCVRCQGLLDDPRTELCRACATSIGGFTSARALGPYEGGWGKLIRALKFKGERSIAHFLSGRLAAYLEEEPFGRIDSITYVPMTGPDRRARGFNQAELLARGVGKRTSLPVYRTLRKVRRTPPQAGLSAREREKNLRGAFSLIKSGRGRILLVDDIYTTGATVQECSRSLRLGGYESVFVLTMARA